VVAIEKSKHCTDCTVHSEAYTAYANVPMHVYVQAVNVGIRRVNVTHHGPLIGASRIIAHLW
jgi:hypothetical protein